MAKYTGSLLLLLLAKISLCQNVGITNKQATYDSIKQVLLKVDIEDQKYRNQMDDVRTRFGGKSAEMKALIVNLNKADSVNLVIVERILNQYGWLGADGIGTWANKTLFMVLQHNDLAIQKKYLPLMKAAVQNKKADPKELAMLEDRIAIREGRSQLYGSQLSWNMQTNTYLLLPIADPDNLDKRRAAIGLGTYADYIEVYGLTWSVEQYKKDLPEIEKQFSLIRQKL